MFDLVMTYDMYGCTYVMRQYELSNSYKVMMVSLPIGLYRVRVKGFRSFVSI